MYRNRIVKNNRLEFLGSVIVWVSFVGLVTLMLWLLMGFAMAQSAINTKWSGGAVSSANVFQIAIPQDYRRLGCQIQNTSGGTEYMTTSATPSESASAQIAAGQPYNCLASGDKVDQAAVYITSQTSGATFVVITW